MAEATGLQLREESIASAIHFLRGEKVMLDLDLSALYGVETKQLKRAVKRNIERFPSDFMFELTRPEFENLRRQIGTSSWGGSRYAPYAFTEQGVAMLSSVLHSKQAIDVNIAIMRTFVQMRTWMSAHRDLAAKLVELEKRHDKNFQAIFEAIKQLTTEKSKPRRPIGFQTPGKK